MRREERWRRSRIQGLGLSRSHMMTEFQVSVELVEVDWEPSVDIGVSFDRIDRIASALVHWMRRVHCH
jgi:hypothetical protein